MADERIIRVKLEGLEDVKNTIAQAVAELKKFSDALTGTSSKISSVFVDSKAIIVDSIARGISEGISQAIVSVASSSKQMQSALTQAVRDSVKTANKEFDNLKPTATEGLPTKSILPSISQATPLISKESLGVGDIKKSLASASLDVFTSWQKTKTDLANKILAYNATREDAKQDIFGIFQTSKAGLANKLLGGMEQSSIKQSIANQQKELTDVLKSPGVKVENAGLGLSKTELTGISAAFRTSVNQMEQDKAKLANTARIKDSFGTLNQVLIGTVDGLEKGTRRYEYTLRIVERSLQEIGKYAHISLMATVGAFTMMAHEAAKYSIEIERMSKLMHISYKESSLWAYRFQASNLQVSEGVQIMKMFGRVLGDAQRGVGRGVDLFDSYAISIKDAAGNNRDFEDVLNQVVVRLQSTSDAATKDALAMHAFGRSYDNVLPLLEMTREQIKGLDADAEKLGITLEDKDQVALRSLQKTFVDLKVAVVGFSRLIAVELAPMFAKFRDIITSISDFFRSHPFLAKLAVQLAVVNAILSTTVIVLTTLTTAFFSVARVSITFTDFVMSMANQLVKLGLVAKTTAISIGGLQLATSGFSIASKGSNIATVVRDTMDLAVATSWANKGMTSLSTSAVKNSGTIKTFGVAISTVFQTIGNLITGVLTFNIFRDLGKSVGSLKLAWEGLSKFLAGFFMWLGRAFAVAKGLTLGWILALGAIGVGLYTLSKNMEKAELKKQEAIKKEANMMRNLMTIRKEYFSKSIEELYKYPEILNSIIDSEEEASNTLMSLRSKMAKGVTLEGYEEKLLKVLEEVVPSMQRIKKEVGDMKPKIDALNASLEDSLKTFEYMASMDLVGGIDDQIAYMEKLRDEYVKYPALQPEQYQEMSKRIYAMTKQNYRELLDIEKEYFKNRVMSRRISNETELNNTIMYLTRIAKLTIKNEDDLNKELMSILDLRLEMLEELDRRTMGLLSRSKEQEIIKNQINFYKEKGKVLTDLSSLQISIYSKEYSSLIDLSNATNILADARENANRAIDEKEMTFDIKNMEIMDNYISGLTSSLNKYNKDLDSVRGRLATIKMPKETTESLLSERKGIESKYKLNLSMKDVNRISEIETAIKETQKGTNTDLSEILKNRSNLFRSIYETLPTDTQKVHSDLLKKIQAGETQITGEQFQKFGKSIPKKIVTQKGNIFMKEVIEKSNEPALRKFKALLETHNNLLRKSRELEGNKESNALMQEKKSILSSIDGIESDSARKRIKEIEEIIKQNKISKETKDLLLKEEAILLDKIDAREQELAQERQKREQARLEALEKFANKEQEFFDRRMAAEIELSGRIVDLQGKSNLKVLDGWLKQLAEYKKGELDREKVSKWVNEEIYRAKEKQYKDEMEFLIDMGLATKDQIANYRDYYVKIANAQNEINSVYQDAVTNINKIDGALGNVKKTMIDINSEVSEYNKLQLTMQAGIALTSDEMYNMQQLERKIRTAGGEQNLSTGMYGEPISTENIGLPKGVNLPVGTNPNISSFIPEMPKALETVNEITDTFKKAFSNMVFDTDEVNIRLKRFAEVLNEINTLGASLSNKMRGNEVEVTKREGNTITIGTIELNNQVVRSNPEIQKAANNLVSAVSNYVVGNVTSPIPSRIG